MNSDARGTLGWVGLVAYVALTDAILIKTKSRTMSSAFRDAIHHPAKRWVVGASWVGLTVHLFTKTKYDPISIIGQLIAEKI
jgi:hypothetical protein